MKNKKGNIAIIMAIVVILVITVGVIVYLFARNVQAPTQQSVVSQPIVPLKNAEPIQDETANWQTYTNEKLGFEIKYPKNWSVEEKFGKSDEFGEGKDVSDSYLTLKK